MLEAPGLLWNRRSLMWKKNVWRVKTIPKIRVFLWRAVSGALAVADILHTRGLTLDTVSKLCNNSTESINHVLFQCLPTREILHSVNLPPDPSSLRSLCGNIKLALEMMSDVTIPEINRRAIPCYYGQYGKIAIPSKGGARENVCRRYN